MYFNGWCEPTPMIGNWLDGSITRSSFKLRMDVFNDLIQIRKNEPKLPEYVNFLDDIESCLRKTIHDRAERLNKKEEDFMKFNIKKVVFNNPATIVFWTDNTKTVVKCGKNEAYDPEKGLAMAICKKYFGNEGNYYNEFRKWLPKTDKNEDI